MRKLETKRFEGLTAIVGNPGKGKTYFLQKLALEYQKKGYIICLGNTGWSLDGQNVVMFDGIEELLTVYLNPNDTDKRIAIFVDEMNALFPSRDWSKTDKGSRDYFALFRHAGVVAFYYCTQSLDDVEKIIRSKTEFVFKCGYIRPLRLFFHRRYSKSDFEKLENSNFKVKTYGYSTFLARKLPTNYDTYARYDKVSALADQNNNIKIILDQDKKLIDMKAKGREKESTLNNFFKRGNKDAAEN